jgi:hypothetical protein
MDNDPKNDRADYAAIKARLAEDAKRLGIDPDEEDLRARANIRRLDETPAFQQKSDDDMSPDVAYQKTYG